MDANRWDGRTKIRNRSEELNEADSDRRSNFFDRMLEAVCNERTFITVIVTVICTTFLVVYLYPDWGAEALTIPQPNGNRPKPRNDISLNSLMISEFRASQAQITGKCEVAISINNLKRRSRYQEGSVVSIFLGHELLWVTRVEDFFVEQGKKMVFNVSLDTTTFSVPASFASTVLSQSRKLRQPLKFKVKYDGNFRAGMAAWQEERVHVYVVCGWIEVQFVDETTLKGGSARCYTEYII